MIDIQALSRAAIKPFLLLVRPGLRQLLLGDYEAQSLIVLGASFWGQPAALLLAQSGASTMHLLDLYVYPDYRRAGIGGLLLNALEQQMPESCNRIHAQYQNEAQTGHFQQLLTKQRWQTAQHSRTMFTTQTELGIGDKHWVKQHHFRPPYEAISWVDVTDAQKERIHQRGEAGWYPASLSPFYRPNQEWDPLLSVALRRQDGSIDGAVDDIVGWALSERHSKAEQTVAIMFVDPPLQPRGYGIKLIGELTRRSIADGIEFSHWGVDPDNQPMLRWTRRALAGTIVDEYIEWTSQKALGGL